MEKHKLKECGFEGCFYDDGVGGNKAVILTIVYSGGSFFCKHLAKWMNKNNIAVIGLTTFGVLSMMHSEGRKNRRQCQKVRIDIKNKIEKILTEW